MTYTREQILTEVLTLLNSVVGDWEFEGTVGPDTRVFADLALESLDLVILGSKVQEHFGQTFPFPQFFAEIGQGGNHDITIGQWVDFITAHLRQPAVGAVATGTA
ncbi:MAG: acyl carrier protein [Vicinamibacterales bacterium]